MQQGIADGKKPADIEKTITVKEHERERYYFDPTMFYENRFWNWRPDGIVINNNHQTIYILEFKRSSDRNEDFLRVKGDEANEQHNSIIGALQVAVPELTFEQIYFVAGRRDAVVEDGFYNKLERLIDDFCSFITSNSHLILLLEGLCSSNPCRFEFSFLSFCRNRTNDLGIDSPAL